MNTAESHARKLVLWGVALFLLGLINGLIVQQLPNPRMGLSAHLAGVQGGLALIVFGNIWQRARFAAGPSSVHRRLVVGGMFGLWLALLLAAIWGAGMSTPIAGRGYQADAWKEAIVEALLVSSSLALVVSAGCLLWRLVRGDGKGA